jgi:hypothetical protein
MAYPIRTDSPQANRASRTIQRTIGTSVTAEADTEVFTIVGGTHDSLENWAMVNIAGALSGGAGLTVGRDYYLCKVAGSSTDFTLHEELRGPKLAISTDLTSGGTLVYGKRTVAEHGSYGNIV